jgi:hypothetical protein
MLSDIQAWPGNADFDPGASKYEHRYVGYRETKGRQGIGCMYTVYPVLPV